MNESEQAQAIAEIRERHNAVDESGYGHVGVDAGDAAHDDRESLLEIVDSQAQKIVQLAKERDLAATIAQKHKDNLDAITKEYEDYKHKSGEAVVDLIDKISEQAKEIQRLKPPREISADLVSRLSVKASKGEG